MIESAAVATTALFAGGALVSQTVVVPMWRAMDPAAFLRQFATYGPLTGGTVFPFEVASVVLLGVAGYSATRRRLPSRLMWVLATACMIGTFVLLPVYFLHANLAMLRSDFPPQHVHSELAAWYRWNWVRTGLGLAAAVLSCVALGAPGRPEDDGSS
ncbi:MAG TPA: DUF1772 domain-containing protein [Micromonosporaceae bacterium]|nr:DUF1772 domain-containing protein [Micromonosporaceae bacterium]